MITFLTDLADQAVTLPLILSLALTLAFLGWPRGAAAWVIATVCTFGLMLLLKLLFLGCGSLLAPTGIKSPSGHAAAAALVAGGLVAVFIDSRPWVASAAILAGFVVGATRVMLGAHTPAEVALGGAVGVGGAIALNLIAGTRPTLRILPIFAVAGVVVFVMHGTRLPAELAIRHTADLLGRIIPLCHPLPQRSSERLPSTPQLGVQTPTSPTRSLS